MHAVPGTILLCGPHRILTELHQCACAGANRNCLEYQSATKSKPGYSNRLAFVFHRTAHERLHTISGAELVQQRHALFH